MPWHGVDPIEWAKKTKDAPRKAVNSFAFEVFKRVVMRTPVDTGQARSNWLVTLNHETDDVKNAEITKKKITRGKNKGKIKLKVKLGQTATQTLNNGKSTIEATKGDDTIFIQNNLPYIGMLEYGGYGKAKGQGKSLIGKKRKAAMPRGDSPPAEKQKDEKQSKITSDGFSLQAPNGMVGVTLAKADQLWERAVKAAKEMNP